MTVSHSSPRRFKDLRPLTSRALTSVLDTLRPYLSGSTVLDLYSGKGRFGFGCLKEGAGSVMFVEREKAILAELKKVGSTEGGTSKFGDRIEYFHGDAIEVLKSLGQCKRHFDMVFADPPFRLWSDADYEAKLFESVVSVLSTSSIFLVRYPKKVVISKPVFGFRTWKTSVFGDSKLQYYTGS